MPGLTAAMLMVEVMADTVQAETGLGRVNSAVQQTAAAGSSLMGVGAAMTLGITVPVVAAAAGAVVLAANYQQTMQVLQATTGATSAQMQQMSQTALQLGADVSIPGVSARDAGVAMLELAKSGLSVNDSMTAARGVLMLAAAGQISVADAATIAGNALNVFHLAGSQATAVADMLAAGANASSASVQDLGLGMQAAGSSFAAAGMNVNDMVTSLALMANAGIRGSDAGTSLKTMLSSLQAPTQTAAKVMNDLGINVRDSHGNMLPMPAIIGQFTNALRGLSPAQQDAALKTIFGSDAIRAARVVIMGGADAYNTMAQKVGEVGAAQKLAAAYNMGAKGALDALRSTVETVAIRLGMLLLPAIRAIALGLADLITWFSRLPGPVLAAIGAFVGVAALVGPVLLLIGAWSVLTTFMAATVPILGITGAALLAIVGVFAIVIAAVAFFAVAYATNFLGIRDITNQVVSAIVGFIQSMVARIMPVVNAIVAGWNLLVAAFRDPSIASSLSGIQGVIAGFGAAARAVWDALRQAWGVVVAFFVSEGQKMITWAQGMWPTVVAAFNNIVTAVKVALAIMGVLIVASLQVILAVWNATWPAMETIVRGVWAVISGMVSGALQVIRGIIQVVLALIAGDWGKVWQGLGMILAGTWTEIQGIIRGALLIILGLFQALGGMLALAWRTAWAGLTAVFSAVWGLIMNAIRTALGQVASVFAPIGAAIATAWRTVWSGLMAVFSAVWSVIMATIRAQLAALSAIFAAPLAAIRQIWNALWAALAPVVTAGLNAVRTVITTVLAAIRTMWTTNWTVLTTVVSAVWTAIRAAVQVGISTVQSLITVALTVIRTLWTVAWNSLAPIVTAAWSVIRTVVTTAIQIVQTAITTGLTVIRTIWTTVWASVVTIITTTWNTIRTVVTVAVQSIQTIITTFINLVRTIWTTFWAAIAQITVTQINLIRTVITVAMTAIQALITTILNAIRVIWQTVWSAIQLITTTVWNAIRTVIQTTWAAIQALLTAGLNAVRALWQTVWSAISAFTATIWNTIRGVIQTAMAAVQSFITSALNTIKSIFISAWNAIVTAVKTAMSQLVSAIQSGISTVLGLIRALPGQIVSALGNLGSLLFGAGQAVIQGFISGITSMLGGLFSTISGIAGKIKALKGPIEKDKVLLVDEGKAIMAGLQNGIRGAMPGLEMLMQDVTDLVTLHTGSSADVMARVTGGGPGASGGGAGPVVVHPGAVQVSVAFGDNADPSSVKTAVRDAVDESFDQLIEALRRRGL
ncbi:MAG: hypothetical protein QOH56_2834 [Pseudonocardiales bacterium]|nr:hypothetical protein [Pseudonocardiales bacterium]